MTKALMFLLLYKDESTRNVHTKFESVPWVRLEALSIIMSVLTVKVLYINFCVLFFSRRLFYYLINIDVKFLDILKALTIIFVPSDTEPPIVYRLSSGPTKQVLIFILTRAVLLTNTFRLLKTYFNIC